MVFLILVVVDHDRVFLGSNEEAHDLHVFQFRHDFIWIFCHNTILIILCLFNRDYSLKIKWSNNLVTISIKLRDERLTHLAAVHLLQSNGALL